MHIAIERKNLIRLRLLVWFGQSLTHHADFEFKRFF